MAQFLYLVPKKDTPEKLSAEYGLVKRIGSGPAYRGCRFSVKGGRPVLPGTDGAETEHDGTVLGATSDIAFKPDVQTWKRVEWEGSPVYWLGYGTKEVPGPDDLVRDEVVMGHAVTLADGNDWIVPVARSFREGLTCLPEDLRMGADGKLQRSVKAAYRELFDRASAVAEPAYSQGFYEIDEEESYRLVVDALAVNYRVGLAEVNALGLLDTRTRHAALGALIDQPTFLELMKQFEAEQAGGGGAKKKDDSPADT